MSQLDPSAVAMNAAGITQSLNCLQLDKRDDPARYDALLEVFEGSIGLLLQVVEAGELMERYRLTRGHNAAWGRELPYLYDVWDTIAQFMWNQLGLEPLDLIVDRAVEQALDSDAG